MIIVVGLGNPGVRYRLTRHNVGFMAADQLLETLKKQGTSWKPFTKKLTAEVWSSPTVTVVKPLTYMNNSGLSVKSVLKYTKKSSLTKLFVVHDDLDIPLGSWKAQLGTGPKIHNGLLSLYETLGSNQFWHIRVGIDSRQGNRELPGHAYVLRPFPAPERSKLQVVLDEVVEYLQKIIITDTA